MWAFPKDDDHVKGIFNAYRSNFENPDSLEGLVNDSVLDKDTYIGIFIPGGHGAMLGLPEDKNVGRVIKWAHDNGLLLLVSVTGLVHYYLRHLMTRILSLMDTKWLFFQIQWIS